MNYVAFDVQTAYINLLRNAIQKFGDKDQLVKLLESASKQFKEKYDFHRKECDKLIDLQIQYQKFITKAYMKDFKLFLNSNKQFLGILDEIDTTFNLSTVYVNYVSKSVIQKQINMIYKKMLKVLGQYNKKLGTTPSTPSYKTSASTKFVVDVIKDPLNWLVNKNFANVTEFRLYSSENSKQFIEIHFTDDYSIDTKTNRFAFFVQTNGLVNNNPLHDLRSYLIPYTATVREIVRFVVIMLNRDYPNFKPTYVEVDRQDSTQKYRLA